MKDAEITADSPTYKLPIAEQLAIAAAQDAMNEMAIGRVLCTSIGRGQAAFHIAQERSDAEVSCHFIELFTASETAAWCAEQQSKVRVLCSSDLPEGEFDLCVLPMTRSGESEFSRDLLQQAYDRLVPNGRLIVTIDNPKDRWFHHEIEKLGKNLTRQPRKKGVVYLLKKLKPLKKLKDFSAEFAFRDQEQLIKVISRPGVFSHRRLDLGARALIESMSISPGDHVLDIGCGAGPVGLAAGLRAPDVAVHFVDANARAVDCAMASAQLNELDDVAATLSHDGSVGDPDEAQEFLGQFDVALGNPPYYSHFQIAEIFLQSARRHLRPGGKLFLVTKNEEWLTARCGQLFDHVTSSEVRGYYVVSGVQRAIS